MRIGTIVQLPEGREGTAVYNGLDGVGIKWGRHTVTEKDIVGNGGLTGCPIPTGYQWIPEAMLRDPYPSADGLECVGEKYIILALSGDDHTVESPLCPPHQSIADKLADYPQGYGCPQCARNRTAEIEEIADELLISLRTIIMFVQSSPTPTIHTGTDAWQKALHRAANAVESADNFQESERLDKK